MDTQAQFSDIQGSGRPTIAVVIPSYRARATVMDVISLVPSQVDHIIVVDDACPDGTGLHVTSECSDERVSVLTLGTNAGVGGATKVGYGAAVEFGADVIVKVDADGQMDPRDIALLIEPIVAGRADYAKGNRFYNPRHIRSMPTIRLIGNAGLTLLTKASSGYWRIADPTNGFTAISRSALRRVELERVADGWFFESDMLFRLGLSGCVVADVPQIATYGDAGSNLSVRRSVVPFLLLNLRNLMKRLVYQHFVRSMTVGALELAAGMVLLLAGILLGVVTWVQYAQSTVGAPTGTVALVLLLVVLGTQFLLAFLALDITESAPSTSVRDYSVGGRESP